MATLTGNVSPITGGLKINPSGSDTGVINASSNSGSNPGSVTAV